MPYEQVRQLLISNKRFPIYTRCPESHISHLLTYLLNALKTGKYVQCRET